MNHEPISGAKNRTLAFRDFSLSETSYRAGTALSPHSHSTAVLSFAVAGGTNVSLGRSAEWCERDALLFLPAGVAHANTYPAAATRVHIEVANLNTHGRPGALRNPIAQELRRAAATAFDAPDNLSEFELTLSLNDAIGLLGSPRTTARSARCEHWLLRFRDYLHEHCTEPLCLRTVACVAGHHPVHVSREFRAWFGKTISDYVRERRIARAARMLRESSLALPDIALDCGFYDQSHLANAFRRTTGVSPSAFERVREHKRG